MSDSEVDLAPVTEDDLDAIRECYNHYVLATTATFHAEPVAIADLRESLFIDRPAYPSFVIREDGAFVGFCYVTRFKKRQAYDRTAEISIYLRPEGTGRGIGAVALERLEEAARLAGIRVLIGTLCGENRASIRLMEKAGYRRCAHLKNVGEKFGRILDVVMYEKEL
jgi:phosphinothricin acetyltransferase